MRSGVPTRLVDDRRPADTLQRRCEQIVLPSEGARPNPPLGGVVVQAGSAIASTAVSVVHCAGVQRTRASSSKSCSPALCAQRTELYIDAISHWDSQATRLLL